MSLNFYRLELRVSPADSRMTVFRTLLHLRGGTQVMLMLMKRENHLILQKLDISMVLMILSLSPSLFLSLSLASLPFLPASLPPFLFLSLGVSFLLNNSLRT